MEFRVIIFAIVGIKRISATSLIVLNGHDMKENDSKLPKDPLITRVAERLDVWILFPIPGITEADWPGVLISKCQAYCGNCSFNP